MYRHYLIEKAGCMEAQCRLGGKFFAIGLLYLRMSAVFLIAESKLELIAVIPFIRAA